MDSIEKQLHARWRRPDPKKLAAKRRAEQEQYTREHPYLALFFRWRLRVRQVVKKISEKFLIHCPPCFR